MIAAGSDGPLLVCLHGIGGSAEAFRHQLDGLASQMRVVARDAPGYASAPDPAAYPGVDGYIEDVTRLVAACGRERAVLLGMSWGGVIAMQVALRRPEVVAGLILGDSTRGSGQTAEQARAMRARGTELAALGPSEFARRRAPRLLSPSASAESVQDTARAMARAIRMPGYGYAAEFMAQSDLGPHLGEITQPTLVLYGAEDIVTGEPESAALAAGIPHARLESIPGAGHLSNQEAARDFNRLVTDFVGSLSL